MSRRLKLFSPLRKFFKGKRRYIWISGVIFIGILLVSFLVFAYFFVLKDIPSAAKIAHNNYPQSTKIYDRHGKLLYTIYSTRNQSFVPLSRIPSSVQKATIAIEDKDFYKHGPIDVRGIVRAFVSTVFKGSIQGGSTITQQLVKNSLLSPEQTISRKVKELVLSFVVESLYSKNQILEMYLNQVSYGGTAWGIQSASYVYFNKPVSDLNLAEGSFLAGLPEAPSLYSPFSGRPDLAKKRQTQILHLMKEQKYITVEQENEALDTKLKFSQTVDKIEAPHFVFYVKDLLVKKYGLRMVEQGGLSVTTSLDLDMQNFAQQTVASEVAKLTSSNVSNGAALVTNPKTGEILAMVGSRNYFDNTYDGNVNVTTSLRQPGSSIKPINYATGLIKGYTAATPLIDQKTCFGGSEQGKGSYCPVNYDGKFHGVTQMRVALANSFNIPAVKMLKINGLDSMIATASAMGISTFKDPERYGLSLTLGGGEVRMTEMAEAFGVFANLGYKMPLQPILKVTDSSGKTLQEYHAPSSAIFGKKVIPEGVAYIISNILSDNAARVIEFGTNSPLKVNNYPVSVKTGTTNDFRDNWTIGYTPSYLVAVWVGNNDNSPMRGLVSGITGAAPIWNKIMTNLLTGKPKESLPKPDSVVGANVCTTSGLLPPPDGTPDRCPVHYEYFLKGTVPNKTDPGRSKVFVDKGTHDLPKAGQTDNLEEKDEVVITDPTGDRYCVTCPHQSDTPTPTP
jgi:1A family penicillin-binding protein